MSTIASDRFLLALVHDGFAWPHIVRRAKPVIAEKVARYTELDLSTTEVHARVMAEMLAEHPRLLDDVVADLRAEADTAFQEWRARATE